MKRHMRGRQLPREDAYLTIFSRHPVPRSRQKRLWPDQLSLSEKKRLLASAIEEQSRSRPEARVSPPCDVDKRGKVMAPTGSSMAVISANAKITFRGTQAQGCELQSGHLVNATEHEDGLTLEDCWPSNDLTLRWLRAGRSKIEAFQKALRRHLSSPVQPCHWPLVQCLGCKNGTSACRLVGPEAKTVSQLTARESTRRTNGSGDLNAATVQCNNYPSSLRHSMNCDEPLPAGNGEFEPACSCIYAQNCALIISEDPILRLSLLAMSLGISEVHTVVMNESNWEKAGTVAKCFGRSDSLKIFRSLEDLELRVFGQGISRALSGEAVPPHTCGVSTDSAPKLVQASAENSTELKHNKHRHLRTRNLKSTEHEVTVEDLLAHLHRYRIVLIDDDYCGPIVSAFGLPRLLEFARTHTCPVCCSVLPRRWQTLMTPASCPPLVTSSRHAGLGDRTNLFLIKAWKHRRFAASGRAMGCSFLRLEDVALSDRFCVFESFEVKSLKRFPNDELESWGDGSLSSDRVFSSDQPSAGHSMPREKTPECLPCDRLLAQRCFRCARDRQLLWPRERPAIVSGNAVCGIEIAGPCAGFIVRSHIVVDEGMPLPAGLLLMVFLPEEVQLSTRHVMMLSPVLPMAAQEELHCFSVTHTKPNTKERPGAPPNLNGSGGKCDNSSGASNGTRRGGAAAVTSASTPAPFRILQQLPQEVAQGTDLDTPQPTDDHTTRGPARTSSCTVPWRNLGLQKPVFRWQWSAICDSTKQLDFDIVVTLRDLLQAAAESADQVPLLVENTALPRGSAASTCSSESCLQEAASA